MTKTFFAAIAAAFLAATAAEGQGLQIENGRATPSVIVGADGVVWPVIPSPCYGGPCPVILAPPIEAPRAPRDDNSYVTCSIARYCLKRNGEWTPPPPRR